MQIETREPGLRPHLEREAAFMGSFRADGASVAGFVVKHGRSFAADPTTFHGLARGEPKMCFKNCFDVVLRAHRDGDELLYCEGYVQSIIPIRHAWICRRDGSILDPTLVPEGRAKGCGIGEYFGVPFKTDWLMKYTFKRGVYGVLDPMVDRPKSFVDLITGKTPAGVFLAELGG